MMSMYDASIDTSVTQKHECPYHRCVKVIH